MRARVGAWTTATLCFVGLTLVVQAYWQVIAAPWVTALPWDTHDRLRARLARPGRLLSRDGVEILSPSRTDSGWSYRYGAPEAFAHVSGYDERTGLRGTLSDLLLGGARYFDWRVFFTEPVPPGCDVVVTLDSRAQAVAAQALKGYRGCVMAVRVGDGAVLAAASAPGFNPLMMTTDEEVEVVATDPYQPLLFRPTQKLYAPGWAMAWVAAVAAIEHGQDLAQRRWECDGAWQCGRMTIRCPVAHGRVGLAEALLRRCRVAITQASDELGAVAFRDMLKALHLLDQGAGMGLPSAAGKMPDLFNWRGRENLADAVLGQRFVRLTPLAVARLFLTMARGGEVVQPYLVAQVRSPSGRMIRAFQAKALGKAVSSQTAARVIELVAAGGEQYRSTTVELGRAEDLGGAGAVAWWVEDEEKPGLGNAWLVGMAPAAQPQILVALVLEDVPDEKMAVELGMSLLNYLGRMAV
ncbi:MAG: penicillin-binding transpeptidase domain-containing protein [Armatimonadetes bacterium]|nr:penicillin-binding transpeptidase domain-containing protein [Armatimonadota bacterium]